MAEKMLALKVHTPSRTLLDEQVDMVILRTVKGDRGILAGHERCTLMLASGIMRVKDSKGVFESYLVDGGYATVEADSVVVMSVLAERVDRVEALMREMEQQRSRRKSDAQKWEQEIKRTEMAIRRVLVGQEHQAYSVLKGRGEGQPPDDAG